MWSMGGGGGSRAGGALDLLFKHRLYSVSLPLVLLQRFAPLRLRKQLHEIIARHHVNQEMTNLQQVLGGAAWIVALEHGICLLLLRAAAVPIFGGVGRGWRVGALCWSGNVVFAACCND